MRLGSYLISILLHAMLFLTILLWPAKPYLDLSQAVQISLVDGASGGELQSSPVLGRRGDHFPQARAETIPAPADKVQAAPPAKPQETDIRTAPEPPKPATEIPRPESVIKQATPPPTLPDDKLLNENKQKPVEAKKAPEPSRAEAIAAALANAQRQAKNDAAQSLRQAAVNRALAEAARQGQPRQGTGDGGGEGDGPGGGGIRNVYVGLVIMAVRPNFSMNTFASRQNIVVTVRIKLDREGNVLDCYVENSSGNLSFDGQAVNAIRRTGTLPPPPTPAEQDLSINFNSQDFLG